MARAWNRKFFLSALIRTAYLPSELPPAISTVSFSKFCESSYAFLNANQNLLTRFDTNYGTFTAPRTEKGRRILAIVNPISQLNVSLKITLSRTKVIRLINKSGTSLYNTNEDRKNSKAFHGLDFRKWDQLVRENCSKNKFVMKADISRFFYTAYTHTIPWAIVGKENVKLWLSLPWNQSPLSTHWSNGIDRALQLCQSRETIGLPVGPDTSRVIAEVLMAGVESDPEYMKATKGRTSFRIIDDFIVGFDDRPAAEKALRALRRALWKYNLQLNEEKTGVFASSEISRDRWKLDFDLKYPEPEDYLEERNHINHLIDTTLHLCSEYSTSTPAIFACNRFPELQKYNENFEIIIDALLRFARDYPACFHHVAIFLITNRILCRELDQEEKISRWVKKTIRGNIHTMHDYEVAWSLYLAGAFQIRIVAEDIGSFDEVPNPVVFALLGLLRENGLLDFPLSKWKWRAHVTRTNGSRGEYLLPMYESVKRNWTTDSNIVSSVRNDPILSRMLNSGVTFLDDELINSAKRLKLSAHVVDDEYLHEFEDKISEFTKTLVKQNLTMADLGDYDF